MFAASTIMRIGGSSPFSQSLLGWQGFPRLGFPFVWWKIGLSAGRKCSDPFTTRKVLPNNPCRFKAFASKKSERKRRNRQSNDRTSRSEKLSLDNFGDLSDRSPSRGNDSSAASVELPNGDTGAGVQLAGSSRSAVLQACIVTSSLLLALGAIARQASHVASIEGWPILDTAKVSFGFEIWHIELIVGLVILISSSRFVLLKTWPDFAESSEAANQQILSQLQPLDFVVVSFLPGISEELLFRGALMPLFGLNWISALVTAAIFGGLHLGSGRKYSYAVWATFVGFAYGLATITSSSVIVPMASHSLNNLIGGLLWRFTSSPQEKFK
ncbi:uncharacterized protein [Typha angustifolia]|uniref:uncharacterized protein n=1 Tax=Typha angustifolia TaxID=59011 RepID=UPI003C2C9435